MIKKYINNFINDFITIYNKYIVNSYIIESVIVNPQYSILLFLKSIFL